MRSAGSWAHPRVWGPAAVLVAVLVGAWELVATQASYLLPSLGAVISSFGASPGFYLSNTAYTLSEAVPGALIGFALAVVLAVVMSEWSPFNRALLPLAVVLNVTPLIVIAPALVAVLGFGRTPKVVLTALITFFPVLINALAGLRSADSGALELLRTLHASRWEVLWRLRLPASIPYLFAAARVVTPLAVVGATVAEIISSGSNAGIGEVIVTHDSRSQLAVVWAAIATVVVLGLALSTAVAVAERRVLHWRGFR